MTTSLMIAATLGSPVHSRLDDGIGWKSPLSSA
jgi:hypothetical protein